MSLTLPGIPKALSRFALNPYVVTFSILFGGLLGYFVPEVGKNIGFMGTIYVDLLKMIILPFMISAVIFSLRSLFMQSENAGNLLRRILFWYAVSLVVVALIGMASALVVKPGSGLDEATLQAFGNMVQSDDTSTDLEVSLLAHANEEEAHKASLGDTLSKIIPSNIFTALSSGETIKVLVFALLFGFAVGHIPAQLSEALTHSLETVYSACQKLTQWFNLLLPIASFSMAAEQIAMTGVEPIQIMFKFILVFLVASSMVLALSVVAIWIRSGRPLKEVLSSQKESFFMAVATRNSTACMPNMIQSLVARLHFDKASVELLVPLGIALLRIGPVVYYTIAVIFIAQLYGRDLDSIDLLMIFAISILAGIASTGMTSIVAVAQTSVVCAYLGLPFEAAFVLFVAVDPIADMLRTAMLVLGINGVSALISPKPSHHQHHDEIMAPQPAMQAVK